MATKIELDKPVTDITGRKPLNVSFHVGKNYIRELEVDDPSDKRRKPVKIVHLYPLLVDWIGRRIPDGVNPRSHEKECLQSPVAKDIQRTIIERPEDFFLANRGSTVLAEELSFDSRSGYVNLMLTEPDCQGIADGATTDAVIGKVQKILTNSRPISDLTPEEIPSQLKTARIHIEVIVGLNDRDRIASLVSGRNTSRQVRPWSMSDFEGRFDWIKDILEKEGCPFAGKVGYEENAKQEVTVLDVLALLTLFHPEFDDSESLVKAPTVAYSGKGRMDTRLRDENLSKSYQSLAPIILDILGLHDYVYSNFEKAYDKAFGSKGKSPRLGRRMGVESLLKPEKLPLTGVETAYKIPSGFIFPVLASLRALVGYHRDGSAFWKVNPYNFFERHGHSLIARLFIQAEEYGGNPNTVGKKSNIYTALHDKARLMLADEKSG